MHLLSSASDAYLKKTQEPTPQKTTKQAGSLHLGLVCSHLTVVSGALRTEG